MRYATDYIDVDVGIYVNTDIEIDIGSREWKIEKYICHIKTYQRFVLNHIWAMPSVIQIYKIYVVYINFVNNRLSFVKHTKQGFLEK